MQIQILPPQVRDQIAAGEVVERPASVIKELIENSIDAGAKNIEIFIENGGKDLIRIKDDGHGMSPEDAEKSILRHATSKIKNIDDLFAIQSFGFRGEALAAISAISNFELISKISKNNFGTILKISAGENKTIEEISSNNGTDISIKNLFFPTPARLQYLKTNSTEYRQITKEIFGFALYNYEVSFKVFNNKKLSFDFPATKDPKVRTQKILKKSSDDICPVSLKTPSLKISGFISRPENCSQNRTSQFLFVNGRRIEDHRLAFAVREAFKQSAGIEHGYYPAFVLFLEIDPILVDVNVHPRKLEVKFSEPGDVFSIVKKSVSQSLEKASSIPQNNFQPQTRVGEFTKYTEPGLNSPSKKIQQTAGSFFSPTQLVSQKKSNKDFSERNFNRNLFDSDENFNTPETSNNIEDQELGELKLIGQVARKYILAENKSGLFIFDQHALHERQRFEMFWKKFENKKIPTQKLLVPQTIKMSETEVSILNENKKDFEELGFKINFPQDDEIKITEIPNLLENENLEKLFQNFVDYFESERISEHKIKKILRKLIEYKACRGAIMFGDKLETKEMQKILEDLKHTKFKWLCAHGRPNYIFHSFDELDHKFHR
ncbi:MAG: DNA mismatch repair endonuclease MutL [Candidatus Peregrinibacteria bacterium]|nr:DNA mismatch repair endonuclease MutL [Candidatus Peregrinibacteria bacterium]